MTKSILFVTGSRKEFGKLKPLALAPRDGDHVVNFWVTGMHMLQRFGLSWREAGQVQGTLVFEYLNQIPAQGFLRRDAVRWLRCAASHLEGGGATPTMHFARYARPGVFIHIV